MKFLILCVVVASFFVVSFGHNLEVSSSHQKVSLLRHGLNKRMRKSELERIKGIGPSTARFLNNKGIKSKSDLIKYINTHTYEEWLSDFQKLRSRKSLGTKLYEKFGGSNNNNGKSTTTTTSTSDDKPDESDDLNDIKGIGPSTARFLNNKGINSKSDLIKYINTHTYEEWLNDFKKLRTRKSLGKKLYERFGGSTSNNGESTTSSTTTSTSDDLNTNFFSTRTYEEWLTNFQNLRSRDKPEENDLTAIKGIGPSTAEILNSKGIKSKSDLMKYINTHTYEEWLNDFKKLESPKILWKKLYKTFYSDLQNIEGVTTTSVKFLFSKGIQSQLDLVRYMVTFFGTKKKFLIDFKRYEYRRELAEIFYSERFKKERPRLFYRAEFERKRFYMTKEHKEMMKKQTEESRKKNEEERKFKDKQNGKKKDRDMNKDNWISNKDKQAFRKNWNDLAKKIRATVLVSTVIQECKSIEVVQQNELHNYCKNDQYNKEYLNSKKTQKMLGDRTRNFNRFKKYVKSKRTGEFKQRKVKNAILNVVEAVQERLKLNDPTASSKLYKACKAFYQSQTVETTKDVLYHYRKCRFGHLSVRDSYPAGKLPGTLHTYWNNVNFLDYQSKDSTLNPNVNELYISMKCPVKEQDFTDCEAKYGTNAKECDKLMLLYVNGCKNDDVVGIWDTFKTTIISVDQEGLGGVWDDPDFHDKVSIYMFRKMKFDDKLQLTFNCQKQQALCTLIMLIGNTNRAKMTFESKDESKLIIEREEDGRVTRKCERFKNDENKCNQYPRDCQMIDRGARRNCEKRPIRIGGVMYKFVAGSSSNRRRLLQSGTSGGAS